MFSCLSCASSLSCLSRFSWSVNKYYMGILKVINIGSIFISKISIRWCSLFDIRKATAIDFFCHICHHGNTIWEIISSLSLRKQTIGMLFNQPSIFLPLVQTKTQVSFYAEEHTLTGLYCGRQYHMVMHQVDIFLVREGWRYQIRWIGTFPKIHPIWRSHPSLSRSVSLFNVFFYKLIDSTISLKMVIIHCDSKTHYDLWLMIIIFITALYKLIFIKVTRDLAVPHFSAAVHLNIYEEP